jgi:hypothetical protein
LVFYFILIPFIKVLFVFDLVLQLKFLICFSFHFDPFFSWLFVKVLLAFNFIL